LRLCHLRECDASRSDCRVFTFFHHRRMLPMAATIAKATTTTAATDKQNELRAVWIGQCNPLLLERTSAPDKEQREAQWWGYLSDPSGLQTQSKQGDTGRQTQRERGTHTHTNTQTHGHHGHTNKKTHTHTHTVRMQARTPSSTRQVASLARSRFSLCISRRKLALCRSLRTGSGSGQRNR